MLATYVIGLREGLEAALIVGIIAAFLKTNGRRLTAMWIGVVAAIVLSIAVGVGLAVVEQSLPQAAQEGMESIIGVVAIFFVTGMIVWMNRHARAMRSDLEQQAGQALRDGHATALVVMAFLAVLKEGFETSVFLLATFSAATDAALAALGAVLGILTAVAIGIGIYLGGIRINLGRFFQVTGAFLILVAAGLVVSTLRTAHEAGWITGGQQRTLDLSGLVAPGSVSSALITGVLGIPADPRLIEVVGWVLYLVPVALYVYWPRRARVPEYRVPLVQGAIAAACAVAAVALVGATAAAPGAPATEVTLVAGAAAQPVGTARLDGDTLRLRLDGAEPQSVTLAPDAAAVGEHAGVSAQQWTWEADAAATAPATLTLDDLVALGGGRLPIGISRAQQTGPFDVRWDITATGTAWVSDGVLLDVSQTTQAVATLSGGGLATPRTVTLDGVDPAQPTAGWGVADDEVAARAAAAAAASSGDRLLWGVQVPVLLGIAAAWLAVAALGRARRRRVAAASVPLDPIPSPSQPRSTHALS